jgi:acyl-CoA synthetase (AMP-forming)/AMP-acid ligase II
VIITGGENVSSKEVEAVLAAHPAVADVAVIGVPDDKWVQRVHAVVVLDAESCSPETELDAWCRERLAGYKRPRSYEFTAALPRNALGKVLKRELRGAHDTAVKAERRVPSRRRTRKVPGQHGA